MIIKNFVKSFLRDLGLKVIKLDSEFITKHDPFLVQKKIMDTILSNPVIFDVGAFHGHVAVRYKNLFPDSKIYCFEPFPDSFNQLKINLDDNPSIKLYQFGLSDKSGKSSFNSNKFAQTNSILNSDRRGDLTWGKYLLDTKEILEIETKTIDQIVSELNIKSIDILKMDVQGSEYKVLKGAKKLLKDGGIKMIYTEIITMPTYIGQLELEDTLQLLREVGFKLVGLYNYSYSSLGQLRQVDGIFIKK